MGFTIGASHWPPIRPLWWCIALEGYIQAIVYGLIPKQRAHKESVVLLLIPQHLTASTLTHHGKKATHIFRKMTLMNCAWFIIHKQVKNVVLQSDINRTVKKRYFFCLLSSAIWTDKSTHDACSNWQW